MSTEAKTKPKSNQTFFVYIVVCKGYGKNNKRRKRYYTGHTGRSPHERLKEHQTGHGGSKWMQKYKWKPLYIGYIETCQSRAEAERREHTIKNWSHRKKKEKIGDYLNRGN